MNSGQSPAPSGARPGSAAGTGSRPRVWTVEDNPDDRELIARAIRQAMPDATIVAPEDEAGLVRALDGQPPDAVVTDFRLGWTDGLEVLARVQARYPAVPVIMFTSTGSEEICAAGMKRGLFDYILKRNAHYPKVAHSIRLALDYAATRAHVAAQREDLARQQSELAVLLERERQARAEAEVARAEALRAAQLKDEFLATLSHELRTPLNAVLGWAEVLRLRHAADAELAQGLAIITRNARLQAGLIADLLDMSRVVSGQMRIDPVDVDLVPTIASALQAVEPTARQKGVELSSQLAPDVGPVRGDGARLQQVVWNLLANAVKFTPPGGRVEVRLHRSDGDACITVVDTGLGIDGDFLPHVFERFRQADGGTTRAHGGLGLGLAIVKSLVDLHGGTVEAQSAGRDGGSTFRVRLPLAADSWAERRREESTLPEPPTDDPLSLAGLKVLVVDDDPETCGLVSRVLQRHGAQVICENSAAAAFARVRRERPDVLLSDIGMPQEDGYALIGRIRSLPAAAGGTVPAAALTAFARSEDRRRALLAGFDSHAPKPIEPSELVAVVASLAKRARATR